MRKCLALLFLAAFSWVGGLGQDAWAGVTIDVVFQDAPEPSGYWAMPGDPGPGCDFGGYYGGSIAWGHCMDVILTSTYDMVGLSTSVTYDSDNGLAVGALYEWRGVQIAKGARCNPSAGLTDNGSTISSFDCSIGVPFNPPTLAAGTYRVGTIVWDTSAFTPGFETISAHINDLFDGVSAVINGNVVFLTSADIVVRSHLLTSDPPCGNGLIEEGWENCDDGNSTSGDGCADWCQIEPGWTCEGEPSVCTEDPTPVPSVSPTGVALLGGLVFGIGLVGLVIAARRRRG